MKTILFICSANVNRSPSAQFWFMLKNRENAYDSAGSCRPACIIHGGRFVTRNQLEQADRIICMEEKNRKDINEVFPGFDSKIEVAGIPDQYKFLQVELLFELSECIKI